MTGPEEVTRIYSRDIERFAPMIETLTRARLEEENEDAPDFVRAIYADIERQGFYNDSDPSSDVLCLYVAGVR